MRIYATAPCPKCKTTVQVVRAGTYGTVGHRRQLLKCRPCGYRFAEPLPTSVIHAGEACDECLNLLAPHQGQPHPRGYQFNAKTVADALARAARGDSYRRIGEALRERTGRARRSTREAAVGPSSCEFSGNLVLDWVESFAPGLWLRHGPRSWPSVMAIDELIVNGRSLSDRRQAAKMWPASSKPPKSKTKAGPPAKKKRGGRKLFTIIGAVGYPDGRGNPEPWLFQAAPSGTEDAFIAFFGALEGKPDVIIGDAGYAWQSAAHLVWKQDCPELVVSEFHLRQMIDHHLARLSVPDGDPLWSAARDALKGPAEFGQLIALLKPIAAVDDSLARWIRRWEVKVTTQLARHQLRSVSRSTGGIEQTLKDLEPRIRKRRWLFANRERMNRLLMLMALSLRDPEGHRRWAASLRHWLEPLSGRPPRQRKILDPGGLRGRSSLRYGGKAA